MKKEQIQILQNAREICDSIAKAITKRNSGQPFCQNYCPGEDRLITIIQQLINAIKDNEPNATVILSLSAMLCISESVVGTASIPYFLNSAA